MARDRAAPRLVIRCPRCGFEADPAEGLLNFCPGCGVDLRAAGDADATPGAFVGRVIAERYRLRELIGEGGMGAVYKAEHIRMGKALALKILRGSFAREPGAIERFVAEARIVSRLSHPHTIAVFDFGEIDGDGSGFYLAMEYVPGQDLAAVLRASGRLPERRIASIGRQILGSLAEAHDAGIVHRDVKPANVMLMRTRSEEDFVKVLDFGIAKLRHGAREGLAGEGAQSASTTSAGAIVGTPTYLAPEQARGGAVDARADLYAVGCLLYELAAGKPPFVAPSPMAVVAAHLQQEPPPLAQQAPGVSRALAEAVHRALRKRPSERFASADEMRAALGAIADALASTPRRPASPTPRHDEVLGIASRQDFAAMERQLRVLRRGRALAPLLVAGAVAAGVWRGADLYALLSARAPRLAQALPASWRPEPVEDGGEREPNDAAPEANPLPLAAGPDGLAGGAAARVRGHVGARRSDDTGDADVFRLEIPAFEGRKVLVASWHAADGAGGIRGLDVALALHRAVPPDAARAAAPLVASADRGGPGEPETLEAAVEPGAYFLSLREQHAQGAAPVERPDDAYLLEVRIEDPRPGEEVEPNDAPDDFGSAWKRYAEWRATALRNPLAEGAPLHAETGPDDPDVYAVEPRTPGEAPELVVAIPDPGLALAARLWRPDTEDLLSARPQDRVRFEEAGDGAPGQILAVGLDAVPAEGEPDLVQLRAAEGRGRYEVVALGTGPRSSAAVIALSRALAERGRAAAALELAAAFVSAVPEAPGRDEVLVEAGAIAARAAADLPPDSIGVYDRAAQLLGEAILDAAGGKVRYLGTFERRAARARP